MSDPPHDDASQDASTAEPEPSAPDAGTTEPTRARRTALRVPIWLAAVIAAVALGSGGFAIGRLTAPDGGGRERRYEPGLHRRYGDGPFGEQGPGRQSAAFLGVAAEDATGGTKGGQVVRVSSGSPAEQAGLKSGDVITKLDGSDVTSSADLRERIAAHQPGDQVTVTYTRGGSSAEAHVRLANRFAPNPQNS